MPAIKGSHIALLMTGICALLTGAILLVNASNAQSEYPSTYPSQGSGEKVPHLHAASNGRAPGHLQASVTEDGIGGTVIRLPPIDIVAHETDTPWVDEHHPVTFVCEATDAPPVEAKQ